MVSHKSTAFLNGYMLRRVICLGQMQSNMSHIGSKASFYIHIKCLYCSFEISSGYSPLINTPRSKEFYCKLTLLLQRLRSKFWHFMPVNHFFSSLWKKRVKFTVKLYSLIYICIINKILNHRMAHWIFSLRFVYFYRHIYVRGKC